MASAFERLARSSRSLVERVHGELVRLSFMNGGKSDGERPQVSVRAIISTEDVSAVSFKGRGGDDMRSEFAGADAMLYLDRATYTGPAPRKGDRVRAIERAGEPIWEFSHVNDRDDAFIIVKLTEAN